MHPSKRTQWSEIFADFRAMIDAIPEAHRTGHDAVCDGCGSALYLVRGRRSGKFFWSHEGLAGCEGVRSIFFDSKQQAAEAERVFL